MKIMNKATLTCVVFATVLLLLIQISQTLIEEKFPHQENGTAVSTRGKGALSTKVLHRQKRLIGLIIGITATVVSASLAIYKGVRGCKDITPNLKWTIDEIDRKLKPLKFMERSVQSRWKVVEQKILLLQQLEKDLVNIRTAITEYNVLITDIVKLIDRNLMDEMSEVEKKLNNDIDNFKEDSIGSLAELEDKFFDASSFAINMAVQLGGLGFMGRKFILRQVNKFTTNQATKWASQNSGRVTKMMDKYVKSNPRIKNWTAGKKLAFKSKMGNIKLKWSKFGVKFPKLGRGLARLGKIGSTLGKGMRIVGKAFGSIVSVALLGLDIWNFIQHTKDCKRNYNEAKRSLSKIRSQEREIQDYSVRIRNAKNDADRNYNQMKANLESDEFKIFLEDVADLGKGAQFQTDEIKSATQTILEYTRASKYFFDIKIITAYNLRLIKAFEKIVYKLRCYKSKLEIRTGVIDKCEQGKSTFSNLFNEAKSIESRIDKDCIQTGYMSKSEIRKLVNFAMESKNLQKDCIRNSAGKQGMVCVLVQTTSHAEIARKIAITTDDVVYFSKQCKLSLSDNQKSSICRQKGESKNIAAVLQYYYHKLHAEVRAVYDECKISERARDKICKLKYDGYTLSDIQKKWDVYSPILVKSNFDKCSKSNKMIPSDVEKVCIFKEAGFSLTSAPFRLFSSKYERFTIIEQYSKC